MPEIVECSVRWRGRLEINFLKLIHNSHINLSLELVF